MPEPTGGGRGGSAKSLNFPDFFILMAPLTKKFRKIMSFVKECNIL